MADLRSTASASARGETNVAYESSISPHRVRVTRFDRLKARLVAAQTRRGIGIIAHVALMAFGLDIPRTVVVGNDLRLPHAHGIVLSRRTRIGDRVTLLHGVTVGRADLWKPVTRRGSVHIDNDAIICAGATILFKNDTEVVVGEGTIVGANSVLTCSTGTWEIWAGNPARKLRDRPQ
jgi:serine O-acetyltransferase